MKKFLTLLLVNVFLINFAVAQDCQPDPMFADSSAGVYPPPFEPTMSPDGGIADAACIGSGYFFNFTVVVSETITFAGATLQLDSIRVDSVAGLPDGLALPNGPFVVCNPGSCSFPANSQGCAAITGTPTGNENSMGQSGTGDYELTIYGSAFLTGFPQPQQLTFPGPIAPGEYILVLEENGGGSCVTGTEDILKDKIGLKAMPNPTTGWTTIDINSTIDDKMQFTLMDIFGKVIRQENHPISIGQNQISVNAANLPKGIYVYSLSNELGAVSKKLIVQ